MEDPDHAVLQRFAARRDDADFQLLARRYLGLIFQTALRRIGDRQLAEEVSQNVLCALAKKAGALAKHPDRLPAWLHRATLFESSKAMRSESSQQRRKNLLHPDAIAATASADSAWADILPQLDLALDRLSSADRDLLLQHYYERKSFPDIAARHASPAATLQKRCRRALDRLARILRGRGFIVTTAALASGFGAELAKAAPPLLLQTATAHALSSSYSTFQLTLFMAAKSKALIPLALLITLTPLVMQQAAISRVASHNESLRASLTSGPEMARRPRSRDVATVSKSGRLTIDTLSRAFDEAARGGALKWIAFEDMIAALDSAELVELIPAAIRLPESRNKRSDLLRHLAMALEKSDPGLAVTTLLAADPRCEVAMTAGLPAAFSTWARQEPDAAFALFEELHASREFNPVSEGGFTWSQGISSLHSALLGSLITAGSKHARDAILMVPESFRHSVVANGSDVPARNMGMSCGDAPQPDAARFAINFIPLLREFVPREQERQQAMENLVFELDPGSVAGVDALGKVMDEADLSPAERRVFAESFAFRKIGVYYNTTPSPDLAVLEAATRQWLERHIPEDATAILGKAKIDAYEEEMLQAGRQLDSIAGDPEINDWNLISKLNRNFHGEMIQRAIEQAERIKDPEKRAEVIRRLQSKP